MQAHAAFLTQWAIWAGQHALPLFFVMLAALQAALLACWWTLRRFTVPDKQGNLLPTLLMGSRAALGFAIILVAIGVFAELAGHLGAGKVLGQADQAFTSALRASVPRLALVVFAAFTWFGNTVPLIGLVIGIAIALVALGRRWLALVWVVAVVGNTLLNLTLKQIFCRVRPLPPDGLLMEPGFSFPSGHSSGCVVAYGMLAYLALRLLPARWHLPALAATVALVFTAGASRVFLSVHFASDVIAGFASGSAWLTVCVTGIEFARWRSSRKFDVKM
jgi:undecaprenyl-diphosphatase